MSASVSDIQQRLGRLDPSDETYRRLLQEYLTHQELKSYILGLQGTNLQEFVEFLDKALDNIPVTDDLFQKALRRLQSACSNQRVLPPSYHISSKDLSNRAGPFAPGDFADAYEAELDGKKVSIKSLRSHSQDTGGVISRIFYREVIVWKRLQHPNIVPFLGVPTNPPPPFEIVFEWMENGTIVEFVRKYPQADRNDLLWDVAEGLHYLHSCKITHGNLKGANVLIDRNDRARLTDFGLASITREETVTLTSQDRVAVGTTTWSAPEILKGGPVTDEGDIFTFAMVAMETFTGYPPFTSSYQSALFDIMSGKRPQRPVTPIHDQLWQLVQRCWDDDPQRRPKAFGILETFQASFPGERETSKTLALRRVPSAWTLADHGVHIDRNFGIHLEPHGQGTREANEPELQDPSFENTPVAAPELSTSANEDAPATDLTGQDADPVDDSEPQGVSTPAGGAPEAVASPNLGNARASGFLRRLGKAFRTTFSSVRSVFSRDRARGDREPAQL